MTLRNALADLVLDSTARAGNTLLTSIRDRLLATLDVRVVNQIGLDATGLSTEATLALIRDEQMRRTDAVMLRDSSSFIGYVGEDEANAARQGRYRWGGGKAATSLASPNASMTMTNPTVPGAPDAMDIIISRYQVEVDAAADVIVIFDAVSTGALRALSNPNRRTEIPHLGELRVGSGVLTGGVNQSYVRQAQPQSPVAVGPFRHRITPGKTWTVSFLGPGASNNVWFTMGSFVVPEGGDLM